MGEEPVCPRDGFRELRLEEELVEEPEADFRWDCVPSAGRDMEDLEKPGTGSESTMIVQDLHGLVIRKCQRMSEYVRGRGYRNMLGPWSLK